MTTANCPFRQFRAPLRAIGQAIIGADIGPLVNDVCRRIRRIRLKTQAGAHVLADREGRVYVLRDQSRTTERIVRREAALYVGEYANETGRPVFPDFERMRIDLVTHFFRVGFLNAGMIYGEVKHSP